MDFQIKCRSNKISKMSKFKKLVGNSPIEMTTQLYDSCQFYENERGAIFDTGHPYKTNMRHGLLTN